MIIDPVTMLKIAPIVMDLVGKYTGKEKAASIFNNILSLSTLGDVFKDPNITQTPSTTSDSVSDFTKSLTIDGVDQVLNRKIAQGLGNNNQANLFDFNNGLLG